MTQPRRQILFWTAAALVVALLMVPLLVVQVPPILDYPNHLARQWFLASQTHDPILTRFYAPHWGVIPNVGVDLLMVGLQRLVPLYVAGKIVTALTIIVQLAGILIYSRVLLGRLVLWPIAFGLVGYSAILLLGFTNFLMSTGFALIAAAAWLRWRERYPVTTTIGLSLAALAIFFVHLLGVAFLGFLIGCVELDRAISVFQAKGRWLRECAWRGASLLAVFLPSALLFFALAPKQQVLTYQYPGILVALGSVPIAFSTYSRLVDALTIGGLIIFIGLCIGWDKKAFPRMSVLQLVVLVVLYLCAPFRLNDEGWLSVRLIYMASLVLFAGVAPVVPRRTVPAVAAAVIGLFCVHILLVSTAWHAFGSELAAFRQVIAPVKPGSKVIVVTLPPKENIPYWNNAPAARRIAGLVPSDTHLSALLMIERHAFWPLLFSVPSQHAIRVRPKYLPLTVPSGELPRYEALTNPTPVDYAFAPYLRDWQRNFDYVLVMNAGGIADLNKLAPKKLKLLTQADIAALYKVKPLKDQLFDATTSTRSSGPPSVAPPTAVTSIKLDETPRSIK
jgi:hypothetical protein